VIPIISYSFYDALSPSREPGWVGRLVFQAVPGLALAFLAVRARRNERDDEQYTRNRATTSAIASGSFALYLRPFASADRLPVTVRSGCHPLRLFKRRLPGDHYDLQEMLDDATGEILPLIAVGKATREYGVGKVSSEDWRDQFQFLALGATAISLASAFS